MEILNVCNKISEDPVELICAFREYEIILHLEYLMLKHAVI